MWIDGRRRRSIESIGLAKAEWIALEEAFEQIAIGLAGSREPDPVLACRSAPMLQCDLLQKIISSACKMGVGVGARDSAMAMAKAVDELCALSLEGGWIREEDSHWADRDPAAHALYNDMPKLALLLVDRGASCDAQLHDGEPLVVWFAKNAGALLLDFLDRAPDLNARGREGGTFLHHLSRLDKFDGEQPLGVYRRAVAKAKARGLGIDVRDHHGRTPLHWAAQMGDMALAQALVEAGADALALSSGGNAPWEEAGSERVADYLEAAALAAREAWELDDQGREKAYLAGRAILGLIGKGLVSIDGKPARDLSDLMDAQVRHKLRGAKDSGKDDGSSDSDAQGKGQGKGPRRL